MCNNVNLHHYIHCPLPITAKAPKHEALIHNSHILRRVKLQKSRTYLHFKATRFTLGFIHAICPDTLYAQCMLHNLHRVQSLTGNRENFPSLI